METMNLPADKSTPIKPSHLNRFFDRIRGRKTEKNEKLNDANKENNPITSNSLNQDESLSWAVVKPQSAREKPRSPLQRLRQRLSIRGKSSERNHVAPNPYHEHLPDNSDFQRFNEGITLVPRTALSENDVRFLCLSHDPLTSTTITDDNHTSNGNLKNIETVGIQSMSLDDVSGKGRRLDEISTSPYRSPSYLRISLGAHGYTSQLRKPNGSPSCIQSNVDRLRLIHERQLEDLLMTETRGDKGKDHRLERKECSEMGNLTTRPVKALVAKIEDLSVCRGKSGDKDNGHDENIGSHPPQLIIIQPKLSEKPKFAENGHRMIEEDEIDEMKREEMDEPTFEQSSIAIAQVIEGASQIATQEAGVREELATKVLNGEARVVETKLAKATTTVIQVQPHSKERPFQDHQESIDSEMNGQYFAQKLDEKKREYQRLISTTSHDSSLLEMDPKKEEEAQFLQEAIASTQLFLNGKMKQFEELIEKNLNPVDKDPCPVLASDLAGWWDLLVIQFDKLDAKFNRIDEMRRNDWTKISEVQISIVQKSKNNNVKAKSPKEVISKEIELKREEANQKRKKMLAEAREKAKALENEGPLFIKSP